MKKMTWKSQVILSTHIKTIPPEKESQKED